MIAWSIEAALQSGCFQQVIVSTDDDEIADIARAWGAGVPFKRPANLADDYTGTLPVVAHAIEWHQHHGDIPTHICCVYATAPFLQSDDLRTGLSLLERECCDYVFPVTSYPFPIQRAIRVTAAGRVEMFNPEHFNTRSQDLEEAYHDAGQFYWGLSEAWLKERPIFSSVAAPLVLPRYRVQDIDTWEDWERAERMFEAIRAK
jgi:N-acylneuraminate cytidylyltransferase